MQKLAKFTLINSSARGNTHRSLVEVEHLRRNPVKDTTIWYETAMNNNRSFVEKLNILSMESGDILNIEMSAKYPQKLPIEFVELNATSIRDYLKVYKK